MNTQNVEIENLFIIGYGMGGGFGGIRDYMVVEADDIDDASNEAYEYACDMYEGYAGSYGLRSWTEIQNDLIESGDEFGEEDIDIEYAEERETWIDYRAFPYSKEKEKEVSGHHYQNNFKHITDV